MRKDIAILVSSCDKYSDVWKPFFLFFNKYWSNCPFPVYLGTNTQKYDHPGVTQIFSNKITSWTDELETILKQIPEKYVVIILEDYFIYKQVDNDFLISVAETMDAHEAAYTKLAAFPKKYNQLWPHKPLLDNPKIGAIEKGAKYRLCLQTAMWNKEILLSLLNSDENPWQFEINASIRSNKLPNPFLCVIPDSKINYVHGPITYHCTALTGGKWMKGAIELCKKEGIDIDISTRPVESMKEYIYTKLYIASPLTVRKGIDYIKNRFKKK